MEYQTVHLFVCQGFSDWEPSYVLPMLNDPTRGSRVRTVGVSREPVKTSGGVTIVPGMVCSKPAIQPTFLHGSKRRPRSAQTCKPVR